MDLEEKGKKFQQTGKYASDEEMEAQDEEEESTATIKRKRDLLEINAEVEKEFAE